MEQFPPNAHESEQESEPLFEIKTEAELFSLLRKSYELSQGNPNLQESLLAAASQFVECKIDISSRTSIESLRINFFKTLGVSITDDNEPSIESDADDFKLYKHGTHIRVTDGDLKDETTRFSNYLNVLNTKVAHGSVGSLTKGIWFRDWRFLSTPTNGRPERNNESLPNNGPRDGWSSAGVNYLIRKNSCGNEVFDLVLATLSPENRVCTPETVQNVVSIYNQHHPDTPVDETQLESYLAENASN